MSVCMKKLVTGIWCTAAVKNKTAPVYSKGYTLTIVYWQWMLSDKLFCEWLSLVNTKWLYWVFFFQSVHKTVGPVDQHTVYIYICWWSPLCVHIPYNVPFNIFLKVFEKCLSQWEGFWHIEHYNILRKVLPALVANRDAARWYPDYVSCLQRTSYQRLSSTTLESYWRLGIRGAVLSSSSRSQR